MPRNSYVPQKKSIVWVVGAFYGKFDWMMFLQIGPTFISIERVFFTT